MAGACGLLAARESIGGRPAFLVLWLEPRAVPTRIGVVLDWFAELEAKVPAR